MANDLFVGVAIGATLSGTFGSVFASAQTRLDGIGKTVEQLTAKQQRIGKALDTVRASGTLCTRSLSSEYNRLGVAIAAATAKQNALNASVALGQRRAAMRGQFMGALTTATIAAAPVAKAIGSAMTFQDQIKDIAITGEFSKEEEASLSGASRKAALAFNQTTEEVNKGLGVLVAGGIQNAGALERYAPVLAKAATATRASMDDLGAVALTMKDSLGIGEEGLEGALNMLAYAGKKGQFEIRDMAKHLPTLAPAMAALGVTGREAVAEMGAALQIARKGAGSNDEAANNFRNFIQKITAPATVKDFADAGIDLQASMTRLRSEGLTPVQAMLEIITQYMGSKGPEAAAEFKQAMDIKDEAERASALQRLNEAYKLGELFVDMQAMSFIRPAAQNKGEMQDIKQGALDAGDAAPGKGLIDEDYRKRMESFGEQFKQFRRTLSDVGLTVGETLLPPLVEVVSFVQPVIAWFGEWAKGNPGLLRSVAGVAAGLLGLKLALLGAGLGLLFLKTPFTVMGTAFTLLTGKSLTMGTVLSRAFGIVKFAATGLFRALLMNPIGLIVTGIAVAAFLIYKHWEPIKEFFSSLWAKVKGFFSSGIGNIAKTILDWSPLGLFYKAFAGVMGYLGVELPDSFSKFGSNLINGLVDGVMSRFTAAKDAIVGFGQNIKGWFTATLGINSPSTVFAGFGDNIAQGAALGIGRSAAAASRASAKMAADALAAAASQRLENARAGKAEGMAGASGGSGMSIQFSPTINVQGGAGIKEQVTEALKMSVHELEQMMARVAARQARTAY
jgi:TP901 family phage tail tape measure protein